MDVHPYIFVCSKQPQESMSSNARAPNILPPVLLVVQWLPVISLLTPILRYHMYRTVYFAAVILLIFDGLTQKSPELCVYIFKISQ